MTVKELQDQLNSTFKIESKFQQILHNERRIDLFFGTLEEAGVKHTDKLVLVSF